MWGGAWVVEEKVCGARDERPCRGGEECARYGGGEGVA